MSLLQIPLEILYQIAQHAGVENLPGLMLSCKHLHRCGQPRLIPDYHVKKQRFTDLVVKAKHQEHLLPDLADYLLSLAKYPEIAYFARSLTVELVRHVPFVVGQHDPRVYEPGLARLRREVGLDQTMDGEEAAQLATEIVHRSAWVCENAGDAQLQKLVHYIKKFAYGSRNNFDMRYRADDLSEIEPIEQQLVLNDLIGLLFANLPYLVKFSCSWDIGPNDYEEEGTTPLMDMIALSIGDHAQSKRTTDNENNNVNKKISPPGIYLEAFHYCPEMELIKPAKPEFNKLAPFLTFPHLRRFFATYLSTEYFPLKPVDSTIEHLELVSCSMDAAQLSQVLSKMPNLTILHYSKQDESIGWDYDGEWDAWSFVNAISEVRFERPNPDKKPTLAEQLTDLAIDVEDELINITYGAGVTLRRFTALKKLALNIQLFLETSLPRLLSESDEHVTPLTYFERRDAERRGLPRPVDILPVSLDELELRYAANTYADILGAEVSSDFKDERAQLLPNLKKVHVRGRAYLPDGRAPDFLISTAKKLGADWVSDPYTQLTWRAEFDRMHGVYIMPWRGGKSSNEAHNHLGI